jgi:hypothetical protein
VSDIIQTITALSAYRIVTILIGFIVIYLGYRLFRLGMYEKAGELKAVWGSRYLILRQAAPGTFFVLFGAVIITVSIWRGMSLEKSSRIDPYRNKSQLSPIPVNEFNIVFLPILTKIANGEKISEEEIEVINKWLGRETEKISVTAEKERSPFEKELQPDIQ